MFNIKEAQQIADEILKHQKNKTKEQIVKKGLERVATVLDRSPSYYLSFGPYWWLIKRMFYKNFPGDKWYQSGAYNAVDCQKYSLGDEFLNWAAAIYYSNQHNFDRPSVHIFQKSDDGDDIQYLLYDEDAPVL
jgi:hypothetical protein